MYNFHMQEPLESAKEVVQISEEVNAQTEVGRLRQFINDFHSKFQSAIKRDEQGEIIPDMVSAELSDTFNILDKKLLLHIAGISDSIADPTDYFLDYVQSTVNRRKNRQNSYSDELEYREFFLQRVTQALELATILYPQNISETPRDIDARAILLQLGLIISEAATEEDISNYYNDLVTMINDLVVVTIYNGMTTHVLADPSILNNNSEIMRKRRRDLKDLEVLVPVFQSYQDAILTIENSNLEEEEKKALLFLLSSPYKQDLTNRENWPNGFIPYYDENSAWITKYLNYQSAQTPGDTH